MIYRTLSDIDVIDRKSVALTLDVIENKIKNSMINQCYITDGGKLVGVLRLDDLYQSPLAEEYIDFPYVRHNEYFRAKSVLYEKELDGVPIVDQRMCLLGDYIRSDESFWCSNNIKLLQSATKKQCVLCAPRFSVHNDLYKQALQYIPSSEDWGTYEPAFNNVQQILIFLDKYDMQWFLYTCHKENRSNMNSVTTLFEFMQDILAKIRLEGLKHSLTGVNIITFNFKIPDYLVNDPYVKNYQRNFREKKKICKGEDFVIPEKIKYEFLDDLYSDEYWDEFKGKKYPEYKVNGITWLRDCDTPHIHIKNGIRITIGQPEQYQNSIYFFGRCVFVGSRVEDANTIASVVQKMVNEDGKAYRVVNLSCWDDVNGRIWKIINQQFKKGDIIVIHGIDAIDGVEHVSGVEVAIKNNMPMTWFTDQLAHCNHHAAKVYATAIYDAIKKKFDSRLVTNHSIYARREYIRRVYIDRYFDTISLFNYKNVGCIVMNCNPFTKGHRYLIESALRKVDCLIIFVVEEEKSYFRFEDRFAMVKAGVADLENVIVAPSGDFILSSSTFPEYFIKIMDKDITRNVDFDIELFAQCIAPALNIKYRFVGSEQHDIVTAQYNKAMHRILPKYGIEIVEIERKTTGNRIISASNVRKYFEYGSYFYDKLAEMAPFSTLAYLGVQKEERDSSPIYVIDTWHDDHGWYRVYSDGFCEQFGRLDVQDPLKAGAELDLNVELYKVFLDKRYHVSLNFSLPSVTEQPYSSGAEINTYNKSPKSFSIHYHNRNVRKTIRAAVVEWRAAGYVFD